MKTKWEDAQKMMKNGLFLIEFSTLWCPDCKMMEPVVQNALSTLKKQGINVKFLNIDAEEAQFFRRANSEWSVLKVPSFFVVKNGIKSHIGYEYIPSETLINAVLFSARN